MKIVCVSISGAEAPGPFERSKSATLAEPRQGRHFRGGIAADTCRALEERDTN